jgi:hypothetical protein
MVTMPRWCWAPRAGTKGSSAWWRPSWSRSIAGPSSSSLFSKGQGRGSARTLGGFDLYQGLSQCQEHLSVFGGHPMAAGVSLPKENLTIFVRRIRGRRAGALRSVPTVTTVEVDAIASLSDLDMVQVEELERLAPFGNANHEPLIVVRAWSRTQHARGGDLALAAHLDPWCGGQRGHRLRHGRQGSGTGRPPGCHWHGGT